MIIRFFCALAALFLLAGPALAVPAGMTPGVATMQPYEGVATTNNEIFNAISTSNTWVNGRATQFLRTPASNLTVYITNCYVATGRVETCLAGTSTIAAAVERTDGTIIQCNGGATATLLATEPTHMKGLFCPGVNGRYGDKIFIRTFLQNPNGIVYSGPAQNNAFLPSNGMVFGSGTPSNLVNSGVIGDTNNFSIGFPPIMVTTPAMVVPCVVAAGDSKMQGQFDVISDQTGDRGYPRIWGQSFGYVNLGIGGTKGSDFVANVHPMEDAVIAHCPILVDEFGINDGGTATSIATMRTSFAALYPAKRVFGMTIGPAISSTTDNYASTGGQTPSAIVGAFNAVERAGVSGEQGVIDSEGAVDQLHLNVYCVGWNPYSTTGTANFCTGPGAGAGLHENSTAYGIQRDYLAGSTAAKFWIGN